MRQGMLGLALTGCVIVRCLAPAGAEAGGAAPPVIQLGCEMPLGAPIPADMLCAVMTASLEDMAPGARVMPASKDGQAALAVTVEVTKLARGGLTGHLQWHGATAPDPKNGPDVQFNVMDARLNSATLGGFTDALIASDPGFLAALQALGGR